MATASPPAFESLLGCAICLCDFVDPRVLPCLHTLCLSCLQQHIDATVRNGRVCCPSCREQYSVPGDGAQGFPKNFFVNTLRGILERGESRTAEQTGSFRKAAYGPVEGARCFNTGHGPGTVFCVDCEVHLCDECGKNHRLFPGAQNHELKGGGDKVGQGESASQGRPVPCCASHRGEVVQYFCEQCRVLICASCVKDGHLGHSHTGALQAREVFRQELTDISKSCSQLTDNSKARAKELDVTESQVNTEADNAAREVGRVAQQIRRLLDQHEALLQGRITDARQEALTDIAAARKELELGESSAWSLKSYADGLKNKGEWTDQAVHLPGLKERLQQQESAEPKRVSWFCEVKKGDIRDISMDDVFKTVVNISLQEDEAEKPESKQDAETLAEDFASMWWGRPWRGHGHGRHGRHGGGHHGGPHHPPPFGPGAPGDGHPPPHCHPHRQGGRWRRRQAMMEFFQQMAQQKDSQ